MTSRTPKFARHGAAFLDPESCGSSVRWDVERTYRNTNNVNVELRDCHKTITWSGYGEDCVKVMRKKLIMAILQMRGCLDAVNELEKFRAPKKKTK